ncbi:MAG: hypothetical protein K8R40_07620 [Anaerolineaceae bacterium]|nr:hypothetical protein [Anaerolineaceae bacterium]
MTSSPAKPDLKKLLEEFREQLWQPILRYTAQGGYFSYIFCLAWQVIQLRNLQYTTLLLHNCKKGLTILLEPSRLIITMLQNRAVLYHNVRRNRFSIIWEDGC